MKLSELAKVMVIAIIIIALVCTLASIIYYRSLKFLPFFFGVLLGSVTSIIKVFLLDHAVDKALTLEKNRAKKYIIIQHILRLLLSGIVLVIGAFVPQISLWGVAAGILTFQLSTYCIKYKFNN